MTFDNKNNLGIVDRKCKPAVSCLEKLELIDNILKQFDGPEEYDNGASTGWLCPDFEFCLC